MFKNQADIFDPAVPSGATAFGSETGTWADLAERAQGASVDNRSSTDPKVSIGIVDYGFDLSHPALLADAGLSRVARLVDQNTGHLITRDDVDTSAYDPHAAYYDWTAGRFGAHGTMMASLLAATAPTADLLAVQLALPEVDWREIDVTGAPSWRHWDPVREPRWEGWRSYLDQQRLADAIEWLVAAAERRGDAAIVINLSLGTWAGPHDGSSRVERRITETIARSEAGQGPVVAVVVPAGNAGADQGHASGNITPGQPLALTWTLAHHAPAHPLAEPHKLEIWYRADAPLTARIRMPDPTAPPVTIDLASTTELTLGTTRVGIADHRAPARGSLGSVRVSCAFGALGSAGVAVPIMIELEAPTHATASVPVHAWIERTGDGFAASRLSPHDPTSTLGGLATADGAIVVGALDHDGRSAAPIALSGAGPHPWRSGVGARLPHVWAPGLKVRVARSARGDFTHTTGTSAACATVAGHLAARLALIRIRAITGGHPVRPALIAEIDRMRSAEPGRNQSDTFSPRQELPRS